jgi:hypothetical protein
MGVIEEALDYSWNVGQSGRIRECPQCIGMGNSDAVQVTRKEDGFLWHCFRCTKSGFIRDAGAAPSQVQAMANRKPAGPMNNKPEVVRLPDDCISELIPQALVDLYTFDIDDEDIKLYNIKWSWQHERIIFPCYKWAPLRDEVFRETGVIWSKKLSGWAGKKLSTDDNKDKPKWHIVRQLDIKHLHFTAKAQDITCSLSARAVNQVVIVEDPISAIRVARAGYHCISLLTTYLPDTLVTRLRDWLVTMWLDEDAYNKAIKYIKKLGSNGIWTKLVRTPKDPKAYTQEEIIEWLS